MNNAFELKNFQSFAKFIKHILFQFPLQKFPLGWD
jgi:hypothetical protein